MPTIEMGARFWSKVDKNGPIPISNPGLGQCWLGLASVDHGGYGRIGLPYVRGNKYHPKWTGAHRVAYELCIGPIPEEKQCDHLCRNPQCVNPSHIELVSARENTMRSKSFSAFNARKIHCPQGHPYDLFNTYIDKLNRRYCKICSAARSRSRSRGRSSRTEGGSHDNQAGVRV